MFFLLENLQIKIYSLPLYCVFHSIRFKVNKGWSTAVLLFLCPYFWLFKTQNKTCARLTLNVRTFQLKRGHVLLKTTVRFFIELLLGIFIYKKEVSAE